MLEYIVSLIAGFFAGYAAERRGLEFSTEKPMQTVLLFLIFFLGVSIGSNLNIDEMIQVGFLSLFFAVSTMTLSFLSTKTLRRWV
jgi:uncharacterized membrane protein YbjE (DUF340 family)